MSRTKTKPPEQLRPSKRQRATLWSPSQVAAYLGLTTRRVNQMIADDEIFAKRWCDRWTITTKEVMRVYDERKKVK